MAYDFELTNEWIEITLNLTNATTVQNKGNKSILIISASDTPTDLKAGLELEPKDSVWFLHTGDKLYARGLYLVDGETQTVSVS